MTTAQHPVNRDLGRPGHPTQFTERERPEADTELTAAPAAETPVVFGKRPTGEHGAWHVVTDATDPLATSDQMQADETLVYRRLPGDAQAIAHRNAVTAHGYNEYERGQAKTAAIALAATGKNRHVTYIEQLRDGHVAVREGIARERHGQLVINPKGSMYMGTTIERANILSIVEGYDHVDELLADFNARAARIPLSWFGPDGETLPMPDDEVAEINQVLSSQLAREFAPETVRELLDHDINTRMLARDWGWSDTDCTAAALNAVSRLYTGRDLPTYGEVGADQSLGDFAEKLIILVNDEAEPDTLL